MKSRLTWSVMLAALGFGSDLSAVEPGLVPLNPNAGFDVSLHGWGWGSFTLTPVTVTWVADDARADPGSGAALVVGPAGSYYLSTCFPSSAPFAGGYFIGTTSAKAVLGTARVRTTLISGFAGDMGEPGNCPGPYITNGLVFDRRVGPDPTFARGVSEPVLAEYFMPLMSLVVRIDKVDGADVVIDDVQALLTDHLQVDGFEHPTVMASPW